MNFEAGDVVRLEGGQEATVSNLAPEVAAPGMVEICWFKERLHRVVVNPVALTLVRAKNPRLNFASQ